MFSKKLMTYSVICVIFAVISRHHVKLLKLIPATIIQIENYFCHEKELINIYFYSLFLQNFMLFQHIVLKVNKIDLGMATIYRNYKILITKIMALSKYHRENFVLKTNSINQRRFIQSVVQNFKHSIS